MDIQTVELIRKEFHHLDSIYFNTAYFGPSPYRAKLKISTAAKKELDPSFYKYDIWMGIPDRIRELIARLLQSNPEQIFHSTSTGDVMSVIANGFPFNKGDVVCSINHDYPSNVLPWMNASEQRGFEFKLLDLGDELIPTVDWLKKNLPENTRIFDVSHVTFDTGKKVDIKSIGKFLKERGIFFIVDATQSLGGMPIDKDTLDNIDVLACSMYKWMLGPYGSAFGHLSENALEILERTTANWTVSKNSKSVANLLDYTLETLPGARRFDRGQAPNMLAMSCLEAGLEFLYEVGLENIQKHNESLRDYFLKNYPSSKYELITPRKYMANILSLKAKSINSADLERELRYKNVDVSVRQGNIRLSFHIFNTTEQIDTLISALDI